MSEGTGRPVAGAGQAEEIGAALAKWSFEEVAQLEAGGAIDVAGEALKLVELPSTGDVYATAPRHIDFINENKDSWAKVRVFDSYVTD